MAKPTPTFGSLSHLPSPSKTLLNKQAMKDYVYFSDNTKGQTGKAVRIKVDLFPRFAALVDPKTHKGQTMIRQIENLRMVNGASAGVYSNVNSVFRFMLKLQNMQIFYTVLDGDGQGRKEIFIGDIKIDFDSGSDKAGLYAYSTTFRRYKKYEQIDLDRKVVYLNGQCNDLDDALRRAHSRVVTDKNNLTIFYVPGKVINELGVWSSRSGSALLASAIDQLSQEMKFNRSKKVGWIAEAEGAEILSEALDNVSGNLTGHKFRLIDPLTETPVLLQKLKAKEINPTGDEVAPVMFTGSNRASSIFMESQKQAVINALKVLRVKGYAEYPHQDTITGLEATAGAAPVANNKTALAKTAALDQLVRHPRSAPALSNKAALSFVSALRRV